MIGLNERINLRKKQLDPSALLRMTIYVRKVVILPARQNDTGGVVP